MSHEFGTEYGIAIPPSSANFHPDFVDKLDKLCPDIPQIPTTESTFGDESPLIKVGRAGHVLMINWFSGRNTHESITDLSLVGTAFTANPDFAGPNTDRLTAIFVYMEARQDHRPSILVENPNTPDQPPQHFLDSSQGVNTAAIVNLLKA